MCGIVIYVTYYHHFTRRYITQQTPEEENADSFHVVICAPSKMHIVPPIFLQEIWNIQKWIIGDIGKMIWQTDIIPRKNVLVLRPFMGKDFYGVIVVIQ